MKKAIIIGASSGIGRALAMELVSDGYHIGIVGRRASLLESAKSEYPDYLTIGNFDVLKPDIPNRLDALVASLGGLDVLVISAGTGELNPTLAPEHIEKTNALNVDAFSRLAVWGYRLFQKQGHGHLVTISSLAGLRGGGSAPSYNATKAYQLNFLEGLRQKNQKEQTGLILTDVRPGFVDTAMAKGEGQFWVAPVEKAARQIAKAIRNEKEVVYITKRWRLIALLLKILPTWLYKRF